MAPFAEASLLRRAEKEHAAIASDLNIECKRILPQANCGCLL